MDLDDYNGNTCNGAHAACMGSAWMMIINGYAGLRIYDGKLHFKPITADGWQSYSFELIEGGDVPIECGENVFALSEKNRAVEIKL